MRGILSALGIADLGQRLEGCGQGVFSSHYGRIESQTSSMAYRGCYLDLDPTYRDAYGTPLLRMTLKLAGQRYARVQSSSGGNCLRSARRWARNPCPAAC